MAELPGATFPLLSLFLAAVQPLVVSSPTLRDAQFETEIEEALRWYTPANPLSSPPSSNNQYAEVQAGEWLPTPGGTHAVEATRTTAELPGAACPLLSLFLAAVQPLVVSSPTLRDAQFEAEIEETLRWYTPANPLSFPPSSNNQYAEVRAGEWLPASGGTYAVEAGGATAGLPGAVSPLVSLLLAAAQPSMQPVFTEDARIEEEIEQTLQWYAAANLPSGPNTERTEGPCNLVVPAAAAVRTVPAITDESEEDDTPADPFFESELGTFCSTTEVDEASGNAYSVISMTYYHRFRHDGTRYSGDKPSVTDLADTVDIVWPAAAPSRMRCEWSRSSVLSKDCHTYSSSARALFLSDDVLEQMDWDMLRNVVMKYL